MLPGEATNTNCIVFRLTRPGLEPRTIYRTQCEHANHYATDARGGYRGFFTRKYSLRSAQFF